MSGKAVTIECEANDTVEEIKQKIEDRTGIPAARQRLALAGLQLQDHNILSDFGVHHSMYLMRIFFL